MSLAVRSCMSVVLSVVALGVFVVLVVLAPDGDSRR
jgi:hypothetical protein